MQLGCLMYNSTGVMCIMLGEAVISYCGDLSAVAIQVLPGHAGQSALCLNSASSTMTEVGMLGQLQ